MKRVIVIGGTGFFGGLITARLRAAGLEPIVASRSHSELRLDADKPEDIRAHLKARDLVIDVAGPFQRRSSALIDAARSVGFDVIDLSDSPEYTAMVYEREAPINAAGIRVLSSCSALSTVSAAILKSTPVEQPRRLSAYLVPATRYTATPATMAAMFSSLLPGTRTFPFPRPIGRRTGVAMKSVDSVTLQRRFPSLRTADLFVDLKMPLGNLLLQTARWKRVREFVEKHQSKLFRLTHTFGAKTGVLGFEIASQTKHKRYLFTGDNSHHIAVIPAVLAAVAIANGQFKARGLIHPADHVDMNALFDAIRNEGITFIAG